MPKGEVEEYKILLKMDRAQRKLLDGFLDKANAIAFAVYQDQKSNLEAGVPLKPEELADKFASLHPELDRETVLDSVERGVEILANVLGGMKPRKSPTRLFAVGPKSVMFAMSEQSVRVPHVGLCGFKPNRKGLAALEGMDGYVARHGFQSAVVGYLYNDPVLILEV